MSSSSSSANVLTTLIIDSVIFTFGIIGFLILRRCTTLFNPKFYHAKRPPKPLSSSPPKPLDQQSNTTKTEEIQQQNAEGEAEVQGDSVIQIEQQAGCASFELKPASELQGAQQPLQLPGNERHEIMQDTKNLEDVVRNREELVEKWKLEKASNPPTHFIVRVLKTVFGFLNFGEDNEMKERCGREVAVYLRFLKLLILVMMCFTALSLVVILPIHMTGSINPVLEPLQDDSWFANTTVQTVVDDQYKLIAHVILCWVFSGLVIALIHAFLHSSLVRRYDIPTPYPLLSNYSIMISNLPKSIVSNRQLAEFVAQAFKKQQPAVPTETPLTSDIIQAQVILKAHKNKLSLNEKLNSLNTKVSKYKADSAKRHYKMKVVPTKITKFEHYSNEKTKTTQAIESWDSVYSDEALLKFVESEDYQKLVKQSTFDRLKEKIARIGRKIKKPSYKSTRFGFVVCSSPERKREAYRYLKKYRILAPRVKTAPEPEDLQTQNLFASKKRQFFVRIATTIGFLVFVFFLSTPLAVISTATEFSKTIKIGPWIEEFVKKIGGVAAAFLLQYIPTLLLLGVSTIIPLLIQAAVQAEKRITLSKERSSILHRIWFYQFLNTLLIPSIGLSSLDALAQYFFTNDLESTFKQLFLVSGGTFFVNYLIQAASIGMLMSLFRPFAYIGRTRADKVLNLRKVLFIDKLLHNHNNTQLPSEELKVKEQEEQEELQHLRKKISSYPVFTFETEYASLLSILSIAMCYSLMIPLITVVGLVYLLLKFYIDRYNFVHLYRRADRHMAKSLEPYYSRFLATILSILLVNLIVMQFAMSAFFVSKQYKGHYIACFVLMGLTIAYTLVLNIVIYSRRHKLFIEPSKESVEPRQYFSTAYNPFVNNGIQQE